MLPFIETELKRQLRRLDTPSMQGFHDMLAYHMGWMGAAGPKGSGGKRIRPLLSLLVCASVGGQWRKAACAAAALELVHNFSLVHDDIQDNSPTRRGRPTLWKRSGMPLAINAGDALFTIANQAALDLRRFYGPEIVITATALLEQACLDLTKGQFLDLHHQDKKQLSLKGYWEMIGGKTAALVAACTQIGALLGGAAPARCYEYRKFGELLGLAFQVRDDILGIWGEEKRTGKSAASDLVEGKLSLPVVYGLGKRGEFAEHWRDERYRAHNSVRLRRLLEDEGGREFAEKHAAQLTEQAVSLLRQLKPRAEAGKALEQLTEKLLSRES